MDSMFKQMGLRDFDLELHYAEKKTNDVARSILTQLDAFYYVKVRDNINATKEEKEKLDAEFDFIIEKLQRVMHTEL